LEKLHSSGINWKKNYSGRKIPNTVGIRWKNLRKFSSDNLVEEAQKLTHIFHSPSYFIISHSSSSKIMVPNVYGIR
jgi:hypothetical protein